MSRQDGGTPGTPETHDDGPGPVGCGGRAPAPAPGATGAAPAARRGRPRSEGVERAVFDAVVVLLDEGVPLAELSIERIARTAGVGKATIYRRWAGKEELFVELLRSVEPPDPVLSGTSVRDDLVVLLESLRERGLAKRTSNLLHNVFAQMQLYPKLWDAYHLSVIEPRRRMSLDTVRRGMERGEIRTDLDVEFVTDLLTGPLLLRTVLRPGASLEPGLAEQVVDTVMEGLRPRD
ncbi:TetR/AcrR family transcriptional regulator [Streptomyces sp. NBC_00250]|uniref:TetR/AcrR family transcriptional regulator n=1 Tax=Streptomyces sp. NBC_00250 TaxID=2903641 RepID=UPI002E288827|nr:TetR/AcrR family transcriptional regulator [Streptomyces sp. NBC_00250]